MKINPYKYPFIAIEGIDGCGKSTVVEGLQKWSAKNKVGAVFTKEPTDNMVGQKIREILNNGGYYNGEKVTATGLQRLYIKDRRDHRQVEALLLQSHPVITDRDFVSTVAYGMAGEVDSQWIFLSHDIMLDKYFFVPDLILILNLLPEESINRLKKKNLKTDFFENLEFLKKVQKNYFAFPRLINKFYPDINMNIKIIDASPSVKNVLDKTLFWIKKCFYDKLEIAECNKIFKEEVNK